MVKIHEYVTSVFKHPDLMLVSQQEGGQVCGSSASAGDQNKHVTPLVVSSVAHATFQCRPSWNSGVGYHPPPDVPQMRGAWPCLPGSVLPAHTGLQRETLEVCGRARPPTLTARRFRPRRYLPRTRTGRRWGGAVPRYA